MSVRDTLMARVRASGSSFYWGIRLLPPTKRQAMAALYLFCRAVDDIADGSGTPEAKRAVLARWRACVGQPPEHCPDPEVGRALWDAVQRFGLPSEPFTAVVDGVSMDLPPGLFAPSQEALQAYCRRVAGAVGLASIRIFGARSPGAQQFALATGDALQFTNILRDLEDDARLGRVYLPRDVLEGAGVPVGEGISADAVLAHPRFPEACAAFAAMAEARYRDAQAILRTLPPGDRRALRPAMVMLAIYRLLLRRLKRRGWRRQDLDHRPSLGRVQVIGLVLRYRFFGA